MLALSFPLGPPRSSPSPPSSGVQPPPPPFAPNVTSTMHPRCLLVRTSLVDSSSTPFVGASLGYTCTGTVGLVPATSAPRVLRLSNFEFSRHSVAVALVGFFSSDYSSFWLDDCEDKNATDSRSQLYPRPRLGQSTHILIRVEFQLENYQIYIYVCTDLEQTRTHEIHAIRRL